MRNSPIAWHWDSTLINALIGAAIAFVLIELAPGPETGHAMSPAAMTHRATKPLPAHLGGVAKNPRVHRN